MQKTIVLDIESSGLSEDSYPIEIAWISLEDGGFDSFLIRPKPDWTYWDEIAELVHGIPRGLLFLAGLSVPEASARLGPALKDCRILSDAPEWDQFWLNKIVGEVEKFELERVSGSDFQEQGAPHRALADAYRLASKLKGRKERRSRY